MCKDEEERKKLIIFINPPFKEAATKTTVTGNLKEDGKPNGFEENKELGGIYEKEDNTEGTGDDGESTKPINPEVENQQ